MSEYPQRDVYGNLVWACCVSSVGPLCEHRRAYRNWLSLMSRNENAPYETGAEHEARDAWRYDRARDGL